MYSNHPTFLLIPIHRYISYDKKIPLSGNPSYDLVDPPYMHINDGSADNTVTQPKTVHEEQTLRLISSGQIRKRMNQISFTFIQSALATIFVTVRKLKVMDLL